MGFLKFSPTSDVVFPRLLPFAGGIQFLSSQLAHSVVILARKHHVGPKKQNCTNELEQVSGDLDFDRGNLFVL